MYHSELARILLDNQVLAFHHFRLTQDGDELSLDEEDDENQAKLDEQTNEDQTDSLGLEDIKNTSDKEEYDTYTTTN